MITANLSIFSLSLGGYLDRTIHKFELSLAIMTTIHVLPIDGFFLSWMSIFQVHNFYLDCSGLFWGKNCFEYFVDIIDLATVRKIFSNVI